MFFGVKIGNATANILMHYSLLLGLMRRPAMFRQISIGLIFMCSITWSTRFARSDESTRSTEIVRSAPQRFATVEVNETPDFQRHILPVLGRLGCNGRSCHGSFQGKG